MFTVGNSPGFTSAVESEEAQVWWKGRGNQTQLSDQHIILDDENTDSGNTGITSTIRGGMILAKETSSGNHYIYAADANDGRQFPTGILEKHTDLLVDNTKTERFIAQMSSGLYIKNEIIADAGTKGSPDLQAQAALLRQGWLSDGNGPDGAAFLEHPMGVERVSATTKTLVAADNGKMLISTAAGNYTLPANNAANVGFKVLVLQTSDNNLVITSAAGDDIIHKGNAAADTVTFGTASEKIGSMVAVELRYIAADTRRWVVQNLGGTTATVAG